MDYEYFDVNVRLVPRSGSGDTLTMTGAAGTPADVQQAEDARAGSALGIDAGAARRGHMALYGLVNLLAQLGASNDSMQRHAFALLVVKERVKNGETADWFDGTRPAEETLEDVDLALRVIADHHAATAAWRAQIVGLTAMVEQYESPAATSALAAQLADSRASVAAWRDAHHQPTVDEYGVKAQELRLPTPENMLAALDKDGYVSAAVQLAKGIATGDASTTIDGLEKLAPKDGTMHTVLDGVASALKGDVKGTIDAVATLGGKEAEVSAIEGRLAQVRTAADATSAAGIAR
jgi:hypothetical protein